MKITTILVLVKPQLASYACLHDCKPYNHLSSARNFRTFSPYFIYRLARSLAFKHCHCVRCHDTTERTAIQTCLAAKTQQHRTHNVCICEYRSYVWCRRCCCRCARDRRFWYDIVKALCLRYRIAHAFDAKASTVKTHSHTPTWIHAKENTRRRRSRRWKRRL